MSLTKEEEKRERKNIYNKKYRDKNKKKILEKGKKYREKNKDKIADKMKEYDQTPAGKKTKAISNWKRIGLICEDYDSLYCHYLNSENCEECNVRFGEKGDGTGTFRCMDHDHDTGLFRNFLCHQCNVKRG